MKKILVQLDTDEHPSAFDAIVAHDAGADVVLSHGRVTPAAVPALVQGAFFTRGVPDLKTLAVWVGGSDVSAGTAILKEVQSAFFGPFRLSVMLDSNGCNTTAAAAVARLTRRYDLRGKRATVIGLGPVGLRSASLLAREGCQVSVSPIPPDVLGAGVYRTPRGLAAARELGLDLVVPPDRAALEAGLAGASVAVVAGPARVQILRHEFWREHPSLEVLLDYNATEPLGIEGIKATDDLAERDGRAVLGALAIGGPKMKTHRACIARLFEGNDLVLDVDGVYAVAKELV